MSYIHHKDYQLNQEFSNEELASITPEQVYQFLAFKAYGREDPNVTSIPIARGDTVDFIKKSISYFIPDNKNRWDPRTKTGNPTQSSNILKLFDMIKKAQVDNRGVKSCATRAFEFDEWIQQSLILRQSNDKDALLLLRPIIVFNWALINRVSDAIEFYRNEIRASPQFDGVLLAKLRWSKNVRDERDCPNQVLFGAYNPAFCVILALAIRLEYFLGTEEGRDSPFVFMKKIPEEVSTEATGNDIALQKYLNKVKTNVRNKLNQLVFKSPNWVQQREGKLGTHSWKKAPMTYAMRRGDVSKDNCDVRGRFKNDSNRRARVSDRYIDVMQPWPDAKVAQALCVGGVVKYSLDDSYGITVDWLFEHVVPNISKVYCRDVGKIFGSALLWACMDVEGLTFVPRKLSDKIIQAYSRVKVKDGNPVQKIRLYCRRNEMNDTLMIDEDIPYHVEASAASEENHPVLTNGTAVITARNFGLQEEIIANRRHLKYMEASISTEINSLRHEIRDSLNKVHRAVNRISPLGLSAPARHSTTTMSSTGNIRGVMVNRNNETDGQTGPLATLSPHPRTLSDMWLEYEVGLGGRKAAKDFTSAERGRCKSKYCRRNVFWTKVNEMIRRGYTSLTAIDKIQEVHGKQLSPTEIIKCLQDDKKRGGNIRL